MSYNRSRDTSSLTLGLRNYWATIMNNIGKHRRKRRSMVLVIAFFSMVACVDLEAQQTPAFEPKVVIKNSFPPIVKPKTVSAKKAAKVLDSRDLVLGVEVNGVSRAYPINMLNGPTREIINDELGGVSIAATW